MITWLATDRKSPHGAPMETYIVTVFDGHSSHTHEMAFAGVLAAKEEMTRVLGNMIINGVNEFLAAPEWRISVSRAGVTLFVLRAAALSV